VYVVSYLSDVDSVFYILILFFHKPSILEIEEFHKLQVACFMFKVHNGLMPSYFANVFHENADVHNYNTRHAHDYHKL